MSKPQSVSTSSHPCSRYLPSLLRRPKANAAKPTTHRLCSFRVQPRPSESSGNTFGTSSLCQAISQFHQVA